MRLKRSSVHPLDQSAGFTLVELMVVVAIIGILASIAIPSYQKYQARARQSEAKIGLAAMYTAEQSFFANEGSYTTCLANITNLPTGGRRYYVIGFGNYAGQICGPAAKEWCNTYKWDNQGTMVAGANFDYLGMYSTANAAMAGPVPCDGLDGSTICLDLWRDAVADVAVAGQNYFWVAAAGYISTKGTEDHWVIDENKNLQNLVSGI